MKKFSILILIVTISVVTARSFSFYDDSDEYDLGSGENYATTWLFPTTENSEISSEEFNLSQAGMNGYDSMEATTENQSEEQTTEDQIIEETTENVPEFTTTEDSIPDTTKYIPEIARAPKDPTIQVVTKNNSLSFDINGRIIEIEKGHELNWFAAYQTCKSKGMQLLTIKSSDENEVITDFMMNNDIKRAWTAGNDLFEEGNWRWMTTGEPFIFTMWSPTNPSNDFTFTTNGENCMELENEFKSNYHNWNDNFCKKQIPFMCETIAAQKATDSKIMEKELEDRDKYVVVREDDKNPETTMPPHILRPKEKAEDDKPIQSAPKVHKHSNHKSGNRHKTVIFYNTITL